MVDAKTLEDLAMSLLKERHSIRYNEEVAPVFDTVKAVVKKYFALDGEVCYGTMYKEDCDLDSLDAEEFALELESVFDKLVPSVVIHNEERDKMHTIYDTVIFFLGKIGGGHRYREVAESSYGQVCEIRNRVMAEIDDCFVGEKKDVGLNDFLLGIEGLDGEKFIASLNEKFIHDEVEAERLSKGTLYEIIEYIVKREVRL